MHIQGLSRAVKNGKFLQELSMTFKEDRPPQATAAVMVTVAAAAAVTYLAYDQLTTSDLTTINTQHNGISIINSSSCISDDRGNTIPVPPSRFHQPTSGWEKIMI